MTDEAQQAVFDRLAISTESFDRLRAVVKDLPEHKMTRPSTKVVVLPFLQHTVTYIVETDRGLETGFTVFLQIVDAQGRHRFVLPNEIAQVIYRQRQSLTDRSTPESRKRAAAKRQREKQRKAREARKADYAARNSR